MKHSSYLIKLTVIFLSMAFGLLVVEGFLRIDGRYADLVNENLIPSRAIWDRPANSTQYRQHPDLDYQIKIVFNDFNIRNHQGINLDRLQRFRGSVVGFFGDSMTENRRVSDYYTFTSVLQRVLDQNKNLVLNFGVDGYGLDQSYIKYKDFRERKKLDYVFYVFSSNDLRNIYENQLFDFRNGKVGEPIAYEEALGIKVLRKFHLTYLIIDSASRIKAKIENTNYSANELNKKLAKKLALDNLANARNLRNHDEYADSMITNFLSDNPSEETLTWVKRFRMLLLEWNGLVESDGGKFSIIVTPMKTSDVLAKKLFPTEIKDKVLYMRELFGDNYSSFRFINDGHWNEYGNLKAAEVIAKCYNNRFWRIDGNRIEHEKEKTRTQIEKLYSNYRSKK